MARTRYYKYEFSNGDLRFRTPEEAIEYCEKNDCHITCDGYLRRTLVSGSIKDGFQSGYQPGLGFDVRHKDEYKRILKERGLVELGNNKPKEPPKKVKGTPEEVIREAVQRGASLSGNEIKALREGVKLHRRG